MLRRRGGAAVLAVAGIAARGSAFVSIILITRFLTVADVAIVLLAQAAAQYLLIVLDFGLTLTGIRAVAADSTRIRAILGATLAIRLGIGLVGIVVILIASAVLGAPPVTLAALAGFGLVAVVTAIDLSWVAQALGSTRLRAAVTAGGAIGGLALTAAFVPFAPVPLSVAVAQLIGVSIAVGVGLRVVVAHHGLPARPSAAAIRRLVVDAVPLGLASLLAQVYYNLDLILIAAWRPLTEVAAYGAAYKVIFGLLMLGWTYAGVALPRLTLAHAASPATFALDVGRDIVTVAAWSVPVALVIAVASPEIMSTLFGPQYSAGALPLAILVSSVPIAAIRTIILYSFTASGRPWAVPLSSGPGAAINVVLNIILIPSFGMVGAAITTVVAEVAVTTVALIQARATLRRIPWRLALHDALARRPGRQAEPPGERAMLR